MIFTLRLNSNKTNLNNPTWLSKTVFTYHIDYPPQNDRNKNRKFDKWSSSCSIILEKTLKVVPNLKNLPAKFKCFLKTFCIVFNSKKQKFKPCRRIFLCGILFIGLIKDDLVYFSSKIKISKKKIYCFQQFIDKIQSIHKTIKDTNE